MSSNPRRTKGVQRGPRSQKVIASVHAATIGLLDQVGYAGLTMEAVAAAAGVHRTTLYRRWPSRSALVASLLEPGLDRIDGVVATGSLEEDLTALVQRLAEDLNEPTGRALARVFASENPELREVSLEARHRVRDAFSTVLQRAVHSGELREDADVEAWVHLLFYGVVHAVLDAGADPVPPGALIRAVCRSLRRA